jgi:hypothetical protein
MTWLARWCMASEPANRSANSSMIDVRTAAWAMVHFLRRFERAGAIRRPRSL